MSTANANTVIVSTQEAYEVLIAHPGSLSGWFDPTRQHGVVQFTTPALAQAARRET